jgi:hypothetical protein
MEQAGLEEVLLQTPPSRHSVWTWFVNAAGDIDFSKASVRRLHKDSRLIQINDVKMSEINDSKRIKKIPILVPKSLYVSWVRSLRGCG